MTDPFLEPHTLSRFRTLGSTACFFGLTAAFLAAFTLSSAWAGPQSVSLESSSVIAEDHSRDGTVLFLDAPVSSRPLQVVVVEEDGRAAARFFLSHKGMMPYETRNLPGWTGKTQMILVANEPGIRGRAARPDFIDELNIFTAPLQYRPSLCNNAAPVTLFGRDFQMILALGTAALFLVLLMVFKKNRFRNALIAAFLCALLLSDIRFGTALFRMEEPVRFNEYVMRINAYRNLLEKWEDRLGNRTWYCKPLPWHYELQTRYMLAGRPYDGHRPAMLIRSRNGRVVMEER